MKDFCPSTQVHILGSVTISPSTKHIQYSEFAVKSPLQQKIGAVQKKYKNSTEPQVQNCIKGKQIASCS